MKECYLNWKPIALKRSTKILQKTIFMCTSWRCSYSEYSKLFLEASKARSTSGDCTCSTCFEIHINYLSDNLQSTCKISANDVSLFSNVLTKTLNDELNENWHKISNWKCKLTSTWKKNAKRNYLWKSSHPVTFNYTEVITFASWK